MVRLAGSWLLPLGCTPGGFACMDDAQCGAAGVCELEGWCSFPDDACPDGRRFGAHAGDGLGGTCVPARADTDSSSSGATTPVTSATTSLDATTIMSSSDADASTTALGSTTSSEGSSGTPAESSTGGIDDPELLVWLDFDDEAAPWADKSGHGNDASCAPAECPELDEGVVGGAARFDGIAQYLAIESALEMSTAFTIAAWIHADTLTGVEYRDVLTRAYGETYFNSWALGFPPDLATLRFVVHDGTTQLVGGDAPWPPLGGWHHVAGTWDGAASHVYLDGVVVAENMIGAVAYDDHGALVGADLEMGLPVNFFAGMIDDVRVYSRALDETEIAVLASAGT